MKIRVSDPKLPDGYEISLTNLNAILLNNQEVEIDDETVAEYEARTGNKLLDVLQSRKFGGKGRPKKEVEVEAEPVKKETAKKETGGEKS